MAERWKWTEKSPKLAELFILHVLTYFLPVLPVVRRTLYCIVYVETVSFLHLCRALLT